jgi:hypothetical protein
VFLEISLDSKQPKLVSALPEKLLFRLFGFYIETANFDVSVKPKLTGKPKNFSYLPLELSLLKHAVLPLYVSVLQHSVHPRRVLHAASRRVCSTAACAALGHVCHTPAACSAASAASGRVCPTAAYAAS